MKPSPSEENTRRVVEILKGIRVQKGLSQNQLARLSGLSRPAISHIESANRLPTLLTCFKLAECLEVNLWSVLEAAEKQKRKE